MCLLCLCVSVVVIVCLFSCFLCLCYYVLFGLLFVLLLLCCCLCVFVFGTRNQVSSFIQECGDGVLFILEQWWCDMFAQSCCCCCLLCVVTSDLQFSMSTRFDILWPT